VLLVEYERHEDLGSATLRPVARLRDEGLDRSVVALDDDRAGDRGIDMGQARQIGLRWRGR